MVAMDIFHRIKQPKSQIDHPYLLSVKGAIQGYELNSFKLQYSLPTLKRYEEQKSERALLYSDVPLWRQRR
jgi:hypothetical protein